MPASRPAAQPPSCNSSGSPAHTPDSTPRPAPEQGDRGAVADGLAQPVGAHAHRLLKHAARGGPVAGSVGGKACGRRGRGREGCCSAAAREGGTLARVPARLPACPPPSPHPPSPSLKRCRKASSTAFVITMSGCSAAGRRGREARGALGCAHASREHAGQQMHHAQRSACSTTHPRTRPQTRAPRRSRGPRRTRASRA